MIKKILSVIGLGIVTVGIVGIAYQAPFVLGRWANKIEATVGTEYKDIKREQFEHSKSYIHGKIEDLQRYKRELDGTSDTIERQALIILIQDEFANFDVANIENSNLRNFLNDIRDGGIK